MKHLAIIQTEFLKSARKWEDWSLEDQKTYLKRHPKSKRRIHKFTTPGQQRVKEELASKFDSEHPARKKDLKKLTNLSSQFEKDKFEVREDFEDNVFTVTNKKGFETVFRLTNKGNFTAIVEGYSSDIPLGDVGKTYKDLKEIVRSINKSWMKENDPHGNEW
jgi:hypothetical protein